MLRPRKKMIADISRVRRSSERGYTLVGLTISAIALMGILGVAVDIGRLYISKNETQVYADAAALAAVTQLNGSLTGLAAARTAAAAAANSWNLNSTNATTGTLEFGTSSAGPWVANPANGTGYSYARATLPVQMPLFFLPVVVSRYQQQVVSVSVASQEPLIPSQWGWNLILSLRGVRRGLTSA